ncbi:hypothetical protein M569_08063 [Genlisea aurea]|uniref:B box-type domain-containing protein n=1 Tax=Genlisea aurea TaxID=192259 RepID=S8CI50_9LAMI|nr:hypothetical protein M569_08063 [Genlisea aurea]
MKRCELCKRRARLQCDADGASLCWDCDSKVHSANFLVARHSRNLLCCVCGSLLMWSADGAEVTPIVSVCEQCADGGESSDGAEEEPEEESVVEENQVVPLSPTECCSSRRDVDPEVSRKRCKMENV